MPNHKSNKHRNNLNSDNTMQKLEDRLRLKKNSNKSSINEPECSESRLGEKKNADDDDANEMMLKRNGNKRSASPDADDSLADFKLPRLLSKPCQLNDKMTSSNNKQSLRNSCKKHTLNRKKTNSSATKLQPSIESLFFKPQTAFICPLCFKSFTDVNIQSTHSKNCAAKNNISTKKLLAATELQERQAEERLAIGLPAAPFQQAKKKSFKMKKMSAEGDPDIQLAMALSKSLSEVKEQEYFDEAMALAAESNEKLLQMSLSQRESTLQNFGFMTNKPIVETVNERSRRRKNKVPTILQTRSQETRQLLLSNKIAEILIGHETVTQSQLSMNHEVIDEISDDVMTLRSDVLKQMYKPNSDLWNQSLHKKAHFTYYVEDLREFISPIKETKEILNSLGEDKEDKIETDIEKSPIIIMNAVDAVTDGMENHSCSVELQSDVKQLGDIKYENSKLLALSWNKMVNSSKYSDVIIHVKNNERIYCHEIVLWTRCRSIQQDLVPNDDDSNNVQRKIIHWDNIDFSSAIAFLEFIYCGIVSVEMKQNHCDLLFQVQQLAEKYKVNELLNDLNDKKFESAQNERNQSFVKNMKTISLSENMVLKYNNDVNISNNSDFLIHESKVQITEDKDLNQLLDTSPSVSGQFHCSRISISPDMFEDMEMSHHVYTSSAKNSNDIEIHDGSDEETLDVLMKLVTENEASNVSTTEQINDDYNEKLYETPKRYTKSSATCPEISTAQHVEFEGNENDNILSLNSKIKQTKSNMSLFIERMHKKNTKGLLDSDTESEVSIEDLKMYWRNPFKIRNYDQSSLLQKYNLENSKNQDKLFDETKEKKSALSLLEDNIRIHAAKNPEEFNASGHKYGLRDDKIIIDKDDHKEDEVKDELNTFSNTKPDTQNESMYTKYKRTHKENSIGKYRSILNRILTENIEEKNVEAVDEHVDARDIKQIDISINNFEDNNEITTEKHEISKINKIRLAELSAFDIYEVMTLNSLNSSSQNSTEINNFLSTSPIDLTECSDDEYYEKSSNTPKFDEANISVDTYKELEFGNWSEEMPEVNDWQPLTQSESEYKKSPVENQIIGEIYNNLSKSSLNEDESIDLTQSDEENSKCQNENIQNNKSYDTITENAARILNEYGLLESTILNSTSNNVKNINNAEVILLSSCSETESVDCNVNDLINKFDPDVENESIDESVLENDLENNFMDYIIEGGADTARSCPLWNTYQQPSSSNLRINDENVTIRFKQSKNRLTTSMKNNIQTIESNSDDGLSKLLVNTKNLNQSRCSSVSPRKKNSTKLLMSKSRSDGNFSSYNKSNKPNLIPPTARLLSYLNLSSDNCEISLDIEPRENYSSMSSPELNEKLSIYGLRNQQRHRAVKLLNHIYDQLHPLVPEYLLTLQNDLSSAVDQNIKFKDDKLHLSHSECDSKTSDSSDALSVSEWADEMMNLSDEDEEYDEKNGILIRESFKELLDGDRTLYNKILKYEPVPLELINEKLKNKGINSGLQILANYLDDECISFFLEYPNKRQQIKVKKKKRNDGKE